MSTRVCITRCARCGLERHGFRDHWTVCPRCASEVQRIRWIDDPAPETLAAAHREHPPVSERGRPEFDPPPPPITALGIIA